MQLLNDRVSYVHERAMLPPISGAIGADVESGVVSVFCQGSAGH